jgi:4-amino-4-deoxy-L-arabinose transferase-like glycosyltransferase
MTDGRRTRAALAAAALVLVVAPLALAARWRWAATPDGRQLRPRPDALEYAAVAQAIAAEGRYYLQVGPYRVRPRYPPGWPLVLAGSVRLGIAGDRLWRVTGVFGAGLASLLALAAASTVWRAGGRQGRRTAAGALAAGLVAGAGWALAPVAVAVGRLALGDEPAAFVAGLSLLATWLAARPRTVPARAATAGDAAPAPPRGGSGGERVPPPPADGIARQGQPARGARAAALGGGLAYGLLAAMRPASALLFAPAVVVLAVYGWRASGPRELLRRAALWGCGAAAVPLLVAGLIWRSGLPPWEWSGYRYWAPRWYAATGTTFDLRYAVQGNAPFTRGSGGRPIPHLRYYIQILLGLPGLSPDSYLGLYWPPLGWLAALLLAWRQRRHPAIAAAALAAAVTLAAHLVFYSLYFFPAARFLLPVLALPPLAAGIACGLGIAAPSAASPARPPRRSILIRLAAGLAAAGLLAAATLTFATFRSAPVPAFPDHDVRAAVAAWLRLPDPQRAATVIPFDPVEAQALGLLPPPVVHQIHTWGPLPPTIHVRRLRALGIIPTPAPP